MYGQANLQPATSTAPCHILASCTVKMRKLVELTALLKIGLPLDTSCNL